jgi:hypothetical protein
LQAVLKGCGLISKGCSPYTPAIAASVLQEVSNLLYGYGHLKHRHAYMMDAVARGCAGRLHEFSTQDLVLTIWSYGKVKYIPKDPACFINACCVLLTRKDQLLPIQIAILVKGFALAGYSPPPAFMDQIAQASIRKLQEFKPVEFSQLLWAYAALGYRDVALFESVVAHAIYLLQAWHRPLPKTTVDTVVYSCQRVGFWPQALIDAAEMRGIYVKSVSRGEGGELIGELKPAVPKPVMVGPIVQQLPVGWDGQEQQMAAGATGQQQWQQQQQQQESGQQVAAAAAGGGEGQQHPQQQQWQEPSAGVPGRLQQGGLQQEGLEEQQRKRLQEGDGLQEQ